MIILIAVIVLIYYFTQSNNNTIVVTDENETIVVHDYTELAIVGILVFTVYMMNKNTSTQPIRKLSNNRFLNITKNWR